MHGVDIAGRWLAICLASDAFYIRFKDTPHPQHAQMPGGELNTTSQQQTPATVVYSGIQDHLFREIINTQQSHASTSW